MSFKADQKISIFAITNASSCSLPSGWHTASNPISSPDNFAKTNHVRFEFKLLIFRKTIKMHVPVGFYHKWNPRIHCFEYVFQFALSSVAWSERYDRKGLKRICNSCIHQNRVRWSLMKTKFSRWKFPNPGAQRNQKLNINHFFPFRFSPFCKFAFDCDSFTSSPVVDERSHIKLCALTVKKKSFAIRCARVGVCW